jgi:hypothetical protein
MENRAGWSKSGDQLWVTNPKYRKEAMAPRSSLVRMRYFFADNDPNPANQSKPAPGANDGASGVAVLTELARTLPQDSVPVWLVFFDAEDQGRFDGWDWILGSRAFVKEF